MFYLLLLGVLSEETKGKICYGSLTLCGSEFVDDATIEEKKNINEIILYQDLKIVKDKLNSKLTVISGDHRIPMLHINKGTNAAQFTFTIGNISVKLDTDAGSLASINVMENSTFVANNYVEKVVLNRKSTLDASSDLEDKINKVYIEYGSEIYNYSDLISITKTAATLINDIEVDPKADFDVNMLNETSYQIPIVVSPVDLQKKMNRKLNHKNGEIAYETLIKTLKVNGSYIHYIQYSKVTTDLMFIYICIGVAAFLIIVAIIIYCLLCKVKVDDGEDAEEALIQKEAEKPKPETEHRRRRHKKDEGEGNNPEGEQPAEAAPATA